MEKAVKTGRSSIVISLLLIAFVFFQIVFIIDGFAGNSIAKKFNLDSTDSYLKWDGTGTLRTDLGRYIISDKIIDEANIDLRDISVMIIENCEKKHNN